MRLYHQFVTINGQLRVFGILLVVWFVATIIVWVVLWTSPTFKFGNHPPLFLNTLGLCFANAIYGLAKWRQSILRGVHDFFSAMWCFGLYLMGSTGAMGIANHDYRLLGHRYVVMVSVFFVMAVADVWIRLAQYFRAKRI